MLATTGCDFPTLSRNVLVGPRFALLSRITVIAPRRWLFNTVKEPLRTTFTTVSTHLSNRVGILSLPRSTVGGLQQRVIHLCCPRLYVPAGLPSPVELLSGGPVLVPQRASLGARDERSIWHRLH